MYIIRHMCESLKVNTKLQAGEPGNEAKVLVSVQNTIDPLL